MALRNASGPGRLASPQHRRIVKLDENTRAEVISIIDNLSNEQWITLTNGVDDVTRGDFAKICVGIVQSLSDATYKMCRPMTVQKQVKVIAQGPKSSVRVASWTPAPSLESPQSNAFIAEIVEEVKLALSSVLYSGVPKKASPSDSTGAWSALFLCLEEEVSSALMMRLDCSDFFTRHVEASCSPASEDTHVAADLVVTSDKEGTESSSQQPEDAAQPDTDDVKESLASSEHEVTTTCTNNVICEIFDTYQSAQLEEETHLKAVKTRESEVSIVTAHFVDNVMIQLKELASAGKAPAFQWIPKNMYLPAVRASVATDQKVLSPQFQIAAQQKVSEVLALSESMSGEAPSGRAASTAKDIVGTLVRSLTKLSHSIDNSPDDDSDASGSVQSIYHSVETKVMNFLWDKKAQKADSDSQSSEDSREEESSGEASIDDFSLAPSGHGASFSQTRSKNVIVDVATRASHGIFKKKDLNIEVSSQSPPPSEKSAFLEAQPSPTEPESFSNRVRKLLCCLSTPEGPAHTQNEGAEAISGVTETGTSAGHSLSEANVSDIMLIVDNEETLAESLLQQKS